MENIRELREWQPLDDLLAKIPAKSTRNRMFPQDMALTCIDAVPEFIAVGTDAGFVFWYNRQTGDMQRLRCEVSVLFKRCNLCLLSVIDLLMFLSVYMHDFRLQSAAPIACLHIVSTVEFMIAAGSECGQLNVFQIRKTPPPDLELMIPQAQAKPIEQYTIGDMHGGRRVRCVRWAKNGMKLFSGDEQGVVVLTEFDYQLVGITGLIRSHRISFVCNKIILQIVQHISKSAEILNETYDIVQIDFRQPRLLIATTYRTIICERQPDATTWRVLQIGKRDRKQLGDFGAAFLWPPDRPQQHLAQCQSPIICARAGFRFWMAHEDGAVQQTILFRDAVERLNQSTYEVPVLNPGVPHRQLPAQFGALYMFGNRTEAADDVVVTWSGDCVYFLHLGQQKVIGTLRRLRHIRSLCVRSGELFVLEGNRNVVRIAAYPDGWVAPKEAQFNQQQGPVEFVAADGKLEVDSVTHAEECFELPPIEILELDTPLHISYDEHDLPVQDQRFLEHSRKVEVFERINELQYDDSILFKPKAGGKKSRKAHQTPQAKLKCAAPTGIVEIGRQAETCDEQTLNRSEPAERKPPETTATSKCSEVAHSTVENGTKTPEMVEHVPLTTSDVFISPTKYPPYALESQSNGRTQEPDEITPINEQRRFAADSLDRSVANEPKSSSNSISPVAECRRMSDLMNVPNLWNMEIVHLPADDGLGTMHANGTKTVETLSQSSETSSFEIVDM